MADIDYEEMMFGSPTEGPLGGAASYYPPPGSYVPLRPLGALALRPGAMPDISSWAGPLGNLLFQVMGGGLLTAAGVDPERMFTGVRSPVEQLMGMTYQQQIKLASGFGKDPTTGLPLRAKRDEAMWARTLRQHYQAQYGVAEVSAETLKQQQAWVLEKPEAVAERLAELGVSARDIEMQQTQAQTEKDIDAHRAASGTSPTPAIDVVQRQARTLAAAGDKIGEKAEDLGIPKNLVKVGDSVDKLTKTLEDFYKELLKKPAATQAEWVAKGGTAMMTRAAALGIPMSAFSQLRTEDAVAAALKNFYARQGGVGGTEVSEQMIREQARAISETGQDYIATLRKMGLPDAIVNSLVGFEQSILGPEVLEASRFMTRAPIMPTAEQAAASFRAAEHFTPEALGTSLLPLEVGGVLKSMGQRGLIPGGVEALDNTLQVQKIQQRLSRYSKMTEQLEDVFGKRGDVADLWNELDRVTQGGLQHLPEADISRMVDQMQRVKLITGIETPVLAESMMYGAQAARSLGMVPAMGAQAVLNAYTPALYSLASEEGAQYFGKRGLEERHAIYSQRLIMGRASPMSHIAGGAMDLIRTKYAVKFGSAGIENKKPSEMLKALGGSPDLVRSFADLESGTNIAAVSERFAPGNMGKLSQELATVTGMAPGVVMESMLGFSRGAQEMSNKWLGESTILRLQDQDYRKLLGERVGQTVVTMMGGKYRGPKSMEIGRAAVEALYTSKKNIFDEQIGVSVVADALKQTGVKGSAKEITDMATTLYKATYNTLENEPFFKMPGGFREFFATPRALELESVMRPEVDALMNINKTLRTKVGPDSLLHKTVLSLMTMDRAGGKTPEGEEPLWKQTLQGLLPSASAEDIKHFGAVLGAAQRVREARQAGEPQSIIDKAETEFATAMESLGLEDDDGAQGMETRLKAAKAEREAKERAEAGGGEGGAEGGGASGVKSEVVKVDTESAVIKAQQVTLELEQEKGQHTQIVIRSVKTETISDKQTGARDSTSEGRSDEVTAV